MLKKLFARLWRRECGATAIEYALIGALISVAAIIAMGLVGGSVNQLFTSASEKLKDAAGGS